MLTKLKTEKLLATTKQLIRKSCICCLKNHVIKFVNIEIVNMTPRPPARFHLLFEDLPPSKQNLY